MATTLHSDGNYDGITNTFEDAKKDWQTTPILLITTGQEWVVLYLPIHKIKTAFKKARFSLRL